MSRKVVAAVTDMCRTSLPAKPVTQAVIGWFRALNSVATWSSAVRSATQSAMMRAGPPNFFACYNTPSFSSPFLSNGLNP